jgi:hypothetical protein
MKLSHYRILIASVVITAVLVAAKYVLHTVGWEPIYLSRLHSSAISGIIFVLGFLLSATIRDYKEAETIPAEAAAALETMHEDVISIKQNYPDFDLEGYRKQLRKVANTLTADLRNSKSHTARLELHELSRLNADLEKAGVPANFIVKLKQQQATLVRSLFRVNYIQRITFIPSATVLMWAIISIGIVLLLLTEIESFLGSMVVTGAIMFILIYVALLIQVIKTPFQDEGKTKDDVSLFLLDRTREYLNKDK